MLSAPMCALLRSSELRRAQSARAPTHVGGSTPIKFVRSKWYARTQHAHHDRVRALYYDRADLKGVLRPACAEHQDDNFVGEDDLIIRYKKSFSSNNTLFSFNNSNSNPFSFAIKRIFSRSQPSVSTISTVES